MVNKYSIVILISGFLLPLFLNHSSAVNILDEISINYRNDLIKTNNEINKLVELAIQFDSGTASVTQIQKQIIETRLSYKRVEHFFDYFQREAVTKYINGAPLPKLETSAPGINIINPNGLQTLDEIIFSDEVESSGAEILALSKKLKQFWNDLYIIEKSKRFQHRYVMEATRYQVWRIYALGLTGFDTPGSVNAIPEAIASLQALIKNIKLYDSFASQLNANEIHDSLLGKLTALIDYLKSNNEFDTLDRMHVLREYVNPIYAEIYSLHKALSIEFSDEVDPTAMAVNYHANTPFDDDFLKKSYFALIPEDDLRNERRIELGRTLFFDPVLSKDLNMSCATCHNPDKAFTDGLAKSRSNIEGVSSLRNSPTLINSVYSERYFHDLREYSLERQVKHVVYDDKEFNMDFVELAERLKMSEEYLQLFDQAYGDKDKYGISTWSISNALATYVASLSSWNSPFDKYARKESDVMDEEVIKGYNLFMGKAACGTCHFAPTFNGTVAPYYLESESEVLGVPAQADTINAKVDPDPGRIASGRAIDEAEHFLFAFKTTTVRNAELTGPYMHNGVYESLDEVLDFYNRGGGAGIGIELENQTLPDTPLELTKDELSSIKSFLISLTDTSSFSKQDVSLPQFGIADFDKRQIDY